jgi:pyrroloquinoline quinone (PQQ) biosynthesis protein C
VKFFDQLKTATASERDALLGSPILARAASGDIDRDTYIRFLTEAYHHVSQTVPLLMGCGARIPAQKEWLRVAVAEYIEEETGHEEWILDDLAACGANAEAVRNGSPSLPTELMVAYAWDTVQRRNPIGFFGMVLVLEGTSIALALQAADAIQAQLELPNTAFRYLRSHGIADQKHMGFFETLMNRVEDPDDEAAIIHVARVMYHLYGEIFRSLDGRAGLLGRMEAA